MGFQKDLQIETVANLPLRPAIPVEAGTIVRAAVARMRAEELGCVVIVDFSGKPIGIFTERSLLDVLMHDASLDRVTVGEFADSDFLLVKKSEPISRVWDAILKDGLRFICVTDDDGNLVGLTGQRGMSEYVSESFPQEVMVQRIGGTPWMQQREGA